MKKITMLALMIVLSISSSVYAGGVRCAAMGEVSSLIDTKNFSAFPQRLVTVGENSWVGFSDKGFWGGVRYHIFNDMAIQINASNYDSKDSRLSSYESSLDNENVATAYNRVNALWSMKLNSTMNVGTGIKFYSNSESSDDGDNAYDHSAWYFSMTPGATMELSSSEFIDAGLQFGFGTFSTERNFGDENTYEYDVAENDGWMDFALNARYYKTGDKVDYAPFFNLKYSTIGTTTPHEGVNNSSESKSKFSTTFGSGIHYKPADGVKVYNDVEFVIANESVNSDSGADENNTNEVSDFSFTVLPTYKMGVELFQKINKDEWYFNTLKIWGGFVKSFNVKSKSNDHADIEDGQEETWSYASTESGTAVTLGLAQIHDNFMMEQAVKISDFDDLAGSSFMLDLVYKFNK